MNFKKFRDLNLISLNEGQSMVIACDSAGGIGLKAGDLVKVSPSVTGYYTVQVCLMELLAFGARPISLVNTLSVEMEDTGRKIISGIVKALEEIGLDESILTGTTEENIESTMTAMGITVIGLIDNKDIDFKKSKKGRSIYVIGRPLVGDEVVADQGKTSMNLSRLKDLIESKYIDEILPVGSKGILYELNEMAKSSDLSYELLDNSLDLHRSGGPSTCVLVSMKEDNYEKLKDIIDIDIEKIGYFIEED